MKYYDFFQPTIYESDKIKNTRYILGSEGENTLLCFGINPSSANLESSDPTMNSLIRFYKENHYDGCIMMNPYPLCTSNPDQLPQQEDRIILEQNHQWIEHVFRKHDGKTALAMWGDFICKRNYFKLSVLQIIHISKKYNITWMHIGSLSKLGNPYHFSFLNRKKHIDKSICPLDLEKYVSNL